MQVEDDQFCFVCGTQNPQGMGVHFEVNPEEQRAHARFTIPVHYQGWQGIVHGGILATLLDEVSVYACRSMAPQLVTAELNVRYRKPAPVGQPLDLVAEVVATKKRYFLVKASIGADGVLYAESESKIFIC
ncbi:MAG: PaaI family thioesterase [Desulfuromonadaceae bacterium]|nr:PaaI family thioesterase [Desulfuromonadaceae bacterium]